MGRGIERTNIFRTDADREDFVNRLAHLCFEGSLVVYAWSFLELGTSINKLTEDSDFVEEVLKASEEKMQRRYELSADGMNLDKILKRAAELLEVSVEEIRGGSRSG